MEQTNTQSPKKSFKEKLLDLKEKKPVFFTLRAYIIYVFILFMLVFLIVVACTAYSPLEKRGIIANEIVYTYRSLDNDAKDYKVNSVKGYEEKYFLYTAGGAGVFRDEYIIYLDVSYKTGGTVVREYNKVSIINADSSLKYTILATYENSDSEYETLKQEANSKGTKISATRVKNKTKKSINDVVKFLNMKDMYDMESSDDVANSKDLVKEIVNYSINWTDKKKADKFTYASAEMFKNDILSDSLTKIDSTQTSIELNEKYGNYKVEWISSDETIVGTDGTIHHPTDKDVIVTLTARITQGKKTCIVCKELKIAKN